MYRSNTRRFSITSILFLGQAAITLTISLAAYAQPTGNSDTFQVRDATSVGFSLDGSGHSSYGGYPYGYYHRMPNGEFGGYFYRSPEDYVNFRGPIYRPIAAVGGRSGDAGNRVPHDDVPLWTDEWAAQIVRNREAAGISQFEPTVTRQTPTTTRQPKPVELRPAPPSIQPTVQTPIRPMRPMQNEPAPATPVETQPTPTNTTNQPVPSIVSAMPRGNDAVPPKVESAPSAPVTAPAVEIDSDAIDPSTVSGDVLILDYSKDGPDKGPTSIPSRFESTPPPPEAPSVAASMPDQPPSEALHRATTAGIMIGRGDMAFESGEYEKARDEYDIALSATGDEPSVRIALGLAEYAVGEYADAAAAIRRGVAGTPDLAESGFRLQNVYGQAEDILAHQQALYDHVDENPEDSDALFLLGFVQYFSDERSAARNTMGAYRSIVAHDEFADDFIESVMRIGE